MIKFRNTTSQIYCCCCCHKNSLNNPETYRIKATFLSGDSPPPSASYFQRFLCAKLSDERTEERRHTDGDDDDNDADDIRRQSF